MSSEHSIERAAEWIRAHRPRKIAALTGAGISAESGVPTFRGSDGLWKNYRAEDLATPQAFERDPDMVWEWYEWRRDLIREAVPNPAHQALARLERTAGIELGVITQNVDGLHALAGSRPLELHGNIFRVRCRREGTTIDARGRFESIPPRCECGALLRPDVVWFGEALDPAIWNESVEAIREADLVMVVGTSGLVYPAAGLAGYQSSGASIEINPDVTGGCTFAVSATAGVAVPRLVQAIEESAR